MYHIHVNPVTANGTCNSTGGHLDPANNGETRPCNPLDKKMCQAGDLSGMYGNITTQDGSFRTKYKLPPPADVLNADQRHQLR